MGVRAAWNALVGKDSAPKRAGTAYIAKSSGLWSALLSSDEMSRQTSAFWVIRRLVRFR